MPTARKPLVFDDNKELQQLQAGDILDAVTGGGDNYTFQNSTGSPIQPGTVCSSGGGTGQIVLADADSAATIEKARAIGLAMEYIANGDSGVVLEAGNMTLDIAIWEIITGEVSVGLTIHKVYFLDPATPGMLTKTPPITGYVVRIGTAIKADTMFVNIEPPIKL